MAKFLGSAAPVYGAAQARAMADRILTVENLEQIDSTLFSLD